MSNIVKGVVMNNKYLMLYNEYLLNNMYNLARTRHNVACCASAASTTSSTSVACCDNCNGSCITSNGSGRSGKYRLVKEFNKSKVSASSLCSKLCSDNIHNDCICL